MAVTAGRQQAIVRYVREQQHASVEQLSAHFGVSEATIRRDLDKLHELGALQRAHGGAVAVERAAPELPIVRRMGESEAEKRAIGLAAAELVRDGETIFLGSGTTTLELARHLGSKHNLKVITNALNIANVLSAFEHVTVIITGGLLRHSELSMIGHLAEQALRDLRADKVIIGIRSLSIGAGLTNEYGVETTIDRALMQFAPEIIVLADSQKWGKVATAHVAPISAVHTVVTTAAAPAPMVAELRELGVEVVLA